MNIECIIMHKHVCLTILFTGDLPSRKKHLYLWLQFLLQRFKFCYELQTYNNKRLLDFKKKKKKEKKPQTLTKN